MQGRQSLCVIIDRQPVICQLSVIHSLFIIVLADKGRRACENVDLGTCPHQVLAAALTLSQPGGTDYVHPILVSTPSFENHRRT